MIFKHLYLSKLNIPHPLTQWGRVPHICGKAWHWGCLVTFRPNCQSCGSPNSNQGSAKSPPLARPTYIVPWLSMSLPIPFMVVPWHHEKKGISYRHKYVADPASWPFRHCHKYVAPGPNGLKLRWFSVVFLTLPSSSPKNSTLGLSIIFYPFSKKLFHVFCK